MKPGQGNKLGLGARDFAFCNETWMELGNQFCHSLGISSPLLDFKKWKPNNSLTFDSPIGIFKIGEPNTPWNFSSPQLCHRRTATIFAAFPDPIQQFVTLHVHSLSSLPPCDADYHCFSPAEQEYRRTGRSILGPYFTSLWTFSDQCIIMLPFFFVYLYLLSLHKLFPLQM